MCKRGRPQKAVSSDIIDALNTISSSRLGQRSGLFEPIEPDSGLTSAMRNAMVGKYPYRSRQDAIVLGTGQTMSR